MKKSEQGVQIKPRSFFLNTNLYFQKSGEMTNYRDEAKKMQMSLDHLIIPERKEVYKQSWRHVKRTQEPALKLVRCSRI